MTVTYIPKMATIKFVVTLQILMRWKGSLYKLVWPDLTIFCVLYTLLSLVYRLLLNEVQRQVFETICQYAREYSGTTTVTFCLGFFVSYILGRWWEAFKTMPWLYTPSYHVRHAVIPPFVYKRNANDELDETNKADSHFTNVKESSGVNAGAQFFSAMRFSVSDGTDNETTQMKVMTKQYEEAMYIRLTLLRYLLVAWIWLMRRISKPILVRFRPQKNLADCTLLDKLRVVNSDPFIQKYFPQLLTDTEIESIVAYAKAINGENYNKYEPDYFLTMDWATDLVHEARARGYIPNDYLVRDMLQSLREFRSGLGGLRLMDMFNVPLVYTQVVALCLYIYLVLNCFATQFTDHTQPDVYVPLPFILQLAFLFGWLRVSEVCLNPFGEDDDDFPTWQMLNMNLETSFKIITFIDRTVAYDLFGNERKATRPTLPNELLAGDSSNSRKISCQSARNNPASGSRVQHPSYSRYPSHEKGNSDRLIDKRHSNTPSYFVGRSDTSVQDSGQPVFEERSDNDDSELLRAYDYERLEKIYDKPAFLGSALENELNGKLLPLPLAPSRAVSIVNLRVSRLMSTSHAPLFDGTPASSRLNLASNIGNATYTNSSKLALDTAHLEEAHPLHTLINLEETSEPADSNDSPRNSLAPEKL